MTMRPKARREALIVETLPDETLVYDERTDKAHCLNAAAAAVWRRCNGQATVPQIARGLGMDEDVVRATLDQLNKAKLLEALPVSLIDRRISRRELGRRVAAGAAFVALPAVLTVVAPTAANAASCVPQGGPCNVSADCCPVPGVCCRLAGGLKQCKPGGGGCL